MTPEETTTIALDEPKNRRTQAREWFIERIAWIVVVLVLLTAALGFLGPGPLGQRSLSSSDGSFQVQYYLVERYEASSELHIRFRQPEPKAEMVQLTLSRSFADETSVECITPEPDFVEMRDDQIICNFRVSKRADEGHIVYRYENNGFGLVQYTVGLLDGPSVDITQFVCP